MDLKVIAYTADPEGTCAKAAGICVGKPGSFRGLASAIDSGHESVIEHASFTFEADDVSRVLLAQLTRHRLASYSVESQRYVDLGDEDDLIIPQTIQECELYEEVMNLMAAVMAMYHRLVAIGVPREDARYITPEAVPTDLIFTMDGRELRHFCELRCCNRAQWETRELADRTLRFCKAMAPIMFANCGPGCVTGECKEARPCGHPRTEEELFR